MLVPVPVAYAGRPKPLPHAIMLGVSEVGAGEITRFLFFQAEDGIRDDLVTGVQTCALPIFPQVDIRKEDVARRCGEVVMNCVRKNIRPRDIATRPAFSNAIAGVAASGGSTNAVQIGGASCRGRG